MQSQQKMIMLLSCRRWNLRKPYIKWWLKEVGGQGREEELDKEDEEQTLRNIKTD